MYISRETPHAAAQRIMERLQQCHGLDIRTHEYHRRVLDHVYLTSVSHLIDGSRWDEAMQIVFTQYRVSKCRDVSEWSHWLPMMKAGLGLFGDVELTDYLHKVVSRDAEVCHRTYEFSMIAPNRISQPSHGILTLGRGQRGTGAMERYLNAAKAWRTRQPVLGYDKQWVPVPDPTDFPPPILPFTGSYHEGRKLAELGEEYAREDAREGDTPKRLEFIPKPPAGYRWSDEWLLGFREVYGEHYLNHFDALRGDLDGTSFGEIVGKEDAAAGRPPKDKLTYVGLPRSGAYIRVWESSANAAYRAAHDATPKPAEPVGGDDVGDDDDVGGWRGRGTGGVKPDDDDLTDGDDDLTDGGDGDPPEDERMPTRAQQSDMFRALSKAINFKRVNKHDEAAEWGRNLVGLLEDCEIL